MVAGIPQRDRNVVAIGVTGHRVLGDRPAIEAGVERAVDAIEQAWPGRSLTVISSLAEGADRLVAGVVLRRPGARLVVPLPLALEEFRRDFTTAVSQAEFDELLRQCAKVIELPPAPSRDDAYAAGGRWVVDHADVVLAVWDGQPAQGAGGTGEIVGLVRKRGGPLAWVRAGNRKPGTMEPTTLGEEQGKVQLERLPVPEPPRG